MSIGRGCGCRRKGVCCYRKESAEVAGGAGSRQSAILGIWPTLGWYTTYGGEKQRLGALKMTPSGVTSSQLAYFPGASAPSSWLTLGRCHHAPRSRSSPSIPCPPSERAAPKRTCSLCHPITAPLLLPKKKCKSCHAEDVVFESVTKEVSGLRSEGQFKY